MMGANGTLPAILEPATAWVQADVGRFLALKAALLSARARVTTPDQLAAIETQLHTQAQLETQLPTALQAAQRLASGTLNFQDGLTVATVYSQIELHIRRTEQVLSGVPAAPETQVNWSRVLVWGGAAVGAWWLLRHTTHGLVWIGAAVGGYLLWQNWRAPAPAGQ